MSVSWFKRGEELGAMSQGYRASTEAQATVRSLAREINKEMLRVAQDQGATDPTDFCEQLAMMDPEQKEAALDRIWAEHFGGGQDWQRPRRRAARDQGNLEVRGERRGASAGLQSDPPSSTIDRRRGASDSAPLGADEAFRRRYPGSENVKASIWG
jgi:hypothetical protein